MVEGNEREWKKIHREATLFDLHAHPSLKAFVLKRRLTRFYPAVRYTNPRIVRSSFPSLAKGHVDVLGSVVYAPERELLDDFRILRLLKFFRLIRGFSGPYFDLTISMLNQIERLVKTTINPDTRKPFAEMALSLEQLNDILSRPEPRPTAFIHTVEGAHSLEDDLKNLDILFQRGVAYLTLAHFYWNEVTEPVFPFPEYTRIVGGFRIRRDLTKGLEPFGHKVVQRMLELGMLIDITHCTPETRRDVYKIVGDQTPLLASHVGVYDINPNPYNLQEWELKKIAETGGVIGIIFMNYWLVPHERAQGIDFIFETIRYLIQKVGVEHIALGSDFDGFTDPPDDLPDAAHLPYLTQRLLAEGLSRGDIDKILGENALRVLQQGWKR